LLPDGPYIFIHKDVAEIITASASPAENPLSITKEEIPLSTLADHIFTTEIDEYDREAQIKRFSFKLHPEEGRISGVCAYELPPKILVTSDIEGNFHTLVSLLLENKVIDQEANWTFGKNHVVINGDLVDRSRNVLPCLWLMYKLEYQAKNAGGAVHYLLGNHEQMNFIGDFRYVHPKYTSVPTTFQRYRLLYGRSSVVGNWMRSKNTMERIGNYLFVHGGISKMLMGYRLSMEQINNMIRSSLNKESREPLDQLEEILCGIYGPLWYRGMVDAWEGLECMTEVDIDNILHHFQANMIFVGHTVVPSFTKLFSGKVIAIDILHADKERKTSVQGLLIEDGNVYVVADGYKKNI
jgi:hypothetical protein